MHCTHWSEVTSPGFPGFLQFVGGLVNGLFCARPRDRPLRLFLRKLDEYIRAVDDRPEGGDISVGRHPADGAVSNVKARPMARALQLVAVQATAGQWAIVVGAAVLERKDLSVDPAQNDEEFTGLVDAGLSFSEVINRGDTDCAGIHLFGAVEVRGRR